MFELEDRYWWFVGRRHIVRSLLARRGNLPNPCRIVDLGCGTGGNLPELAQFGEVVGVDMSPEALHLCRSRGDFPLALSDGTALPFREDSCDLVTVLDVLEHIEDDRRVLEELVRILRPGGKVLVTVPAYPSLWSEHDEALHHQRRYRAHELRGKVRASGLTIRKLSFAISAVLLPVYFLRWMQRFRRQPPRESAKTGLIELPAMVNGLLIAYLRFEGSWIPHMSLPFGLSIVCLAEKEAED
ncbi:MAG: class I SAM-dependent methyltransferase [Armatimonadetes bacterium]|nr:class I SAM-dependent methyltransferase [Armatimonadota bacterium]